MKRLVPLDNPPPYIDRYIEIRDSKMKAVRARLASVHQQVEAQYDRYINAARGGNLAGLRADAACEVLTDDLRACYDGRTKALEQLKGDIKGAQPRRQLKYCPMCGITLPKTFDHYAPASDFPEFSVLALNLVPCCSECNSIKDDRWLRSGNQRMFLHLYSDRIPAAQFLFADLLIRRTALGATFRISPPQGVDDDDWDLIESHFEELHLIERFGERSNDEVAEIIADCRILQEEGGHDCAAFLRRRAKERRAIYGRNHWQPVLMDAMAVHPRLQDWIDQ